MINWTITPKQFICITIFLLVVPFLLPFILWILIKPIFWIAFVIGAIIHHYTEPTFGKKKEKPQKSNLKKYNPLDDFSKL